MSEEIEIKLTYDNYEKVINKLSDEWNLVNKLDIIDYYYGKEDKPMNELAEFFRVRRKGEEIILTYKGSNEGSGKITRKTEHNLKVNSFQTAIDILKETPLVQVAKRETEREIWKKDNVELAFITYHKPFKVKFIEIEADSEEQIEEVLDNLGDAVQKATDRDIFEKFDKQSN